MNRCQFTFYRSFWEGIKLLPKKQRGEALEAIVRYALDEDMIQLSGASSAIFVLAKPTLDASRKKAENRMNKESSEEQNENKSESSEEQNGKKREEERESKYKRECESEYEKESLYIPPKPPDGGGPPAKAPAKFQKPTLDEIAAYCLERGNAIDPEAFYAHYESNGWKVGRNPMKSWRQAVITWEHSDYKGGRIKKGGLTPDEIKRMEERGDFENVEADW